MNKLIVVLAALVAGGVPGGLPGEAEAAKKTIYNVEILNTDTLWTMTDPTANNESPAVWVASPYKAVPGPERGVIASEGITFQLEVKEKAKTKKVRIGKQKVKTTYYPVTIKKKSFKAPIAEYVIVQGEDVYEMEMVTKMTKNAKGKLYISDTDVDLSHVQGIGVKKPKTRIGDGTVDPPGSPIIGMKFVIRHGSGGETLWTDKVTTTWTTGKSSTLVKGAKSWLEGMAFPEDDPSGLLPTPLVGEPLDLDAGTGTLVSTATSKNMKPKVAILEAFTRTKIEGKLHSLRGQVWG
jgi:hypothetical protein